MKMKQNNKPIKIEHHEAAAIEQVLKVLREPRSDRPVALVILFTGDQMSISRADPRGLVVIRP